jgi:hypothetical protein
MGMFDEIICRRPLPGTVPGFITGDHRFQTKDLDCTLATYVIGEDGAIRQEGYKELLDFSGDIEFYTSNITGQGPGVYTQNGEVAESVTFVAKVASGVVYELKQEAHERTPALPAAQHFTPRPRPTAEDIAEWERRQSESLIGRTVYVLWGGQEVGYGATVIAESAKKWCLQTADGDLELMDRRVRDHIMWDTEEEAFAARDAKRKEWERQKSEYDAHAAANAGH